MKKKGFTLIELLAVIIVLSIIALITIPVVTSTIKNAKKGVAEVSIQNYIRAVELTISNSELNKKHISDGTYDIDSDGNLKGEGLPDGKLVIDASGDKPTSGTIVIKSGQVTTDSKMTIGDYDVAYNPTSKVYEATEKESKTQKYSNGEVVYFNVTTGNKCSSSDYTETQSNTGAKEGCMKFYAFNDDGGDTVNLILDHNTTAGLIPASASSQLKVDTNSWLGTETPSDTTINYSGYNARLMTFQEITQITNNNKTFDHTKNSNSYYFDSNESTASDTCKSGNTNGCQYGWLYDRTALDCTTNGCLNNSDQETAGYWTSTPTYLDDGTDWYFGVDSRASVSMAPGYYGDKNYSSAVGYGVRPVIEVLKSKLS